MKKIPFASCIFALLAAVLGACTLYLTVQNLNTPPVLVRAPEDASQRVETLMEAVCAGDYAGAQAVLYGTPDLGADRAPADPVGQLIWEAFVESTSCTLSGECYVARSGLAQDVQWRSLELASVTENLGQRAQVLLEQRVEAAADTSEIYDEENNYREDFVMEVLYEAALQAIEEDARYTEKTITLHLTYAQGQWWVMPEQELLSAVSGGIAG